MEMAENMDPTWKNPLDPNNLSQNEKEKLIQFKSEFFDQSLKNHKSYLADEFYLIHWLKARKFDVLKAKQMLHNHLEFRDAMAMDEPKYVSYEVDPILVKFYPRGQYGIAKNGMPCVYFPLGGIDSKGILQSVRVSDMYRAIMYWQEERKTVNKLESNKSGKPVQQVYYILDLKGLGTSHLYGPGLEVFQQVTKLVEKHTPEITFKIFILNAPAVFSFVYRLIKPILDQTTQNKLNIFGNDGWKSALLSEIDCDQLPEYYGGTCTGPDGDPNCLHKITYGGVVPQELYFCKDKKESLMPSALRTLNVPRGSATLLKFSTLPKKCLRWYFEVDTGCDIGFAVYKCNEPAMETNKEQQAELEEINGDIKIVDNMQMVVPYFRLLTHLVPEWGSVDVQDSVYYILFDNSYSWLHGKSVQYSIQIDDYKAAL